MAIAGPHDREQADLSLTVAALTVAAGADRRDHLVMSDTTSDLSAPLPVLPSTSRCCGRRLWTATALMLLGFGMGQVDWVGAVAAQDDAEVAEEPLPEEVANEIRAANRALVSARDELERQRRYVVATEGVNAYLVLSGGGNAIEDLESGDGVDPETFAALYAGKAIPDVKQHLSVDDEGRLLYKNRIVRMYSKSRLKAMATQQDLFATDGR